MPAPPTTDVLGVDVVAVEPPASVAPSSDWRPWRLLGIVAVYLVVVYVVPRPDSVAPPGWRLTAVFLSTIAGLMLRPLPGAGIVILGLLGVGTLGGVPIARVLGGFASPTVWLVLIAMLVSRAFKDTGLARRIALGFVHVVGHSSLGISYALALSDITLAAGIPSITARSGGIVLPVARSIAELYDSRPGVTASRLGTFLMTAMYQTSAVACAMFITGQASNVLAARMAQQAVGYTVTASSWFVAAVVPGLVSTLIVPWVVYRMLTPGITRTPAARAYTQEQLAAIGPIRGKEAIALAVFVAVAGLWLTTGLHGLDVTLVALGGLGVLLLTGTLDWPSALTEKPAWDNFVWYGGLFTMGELLNETGSTRAFAEWIGRSFGTLPWFTALLLTLVVFFYAHYAFASITAHILALFVPFVVMLVGLGVPVALAVYSLACLANLTAGLTHYGTTTSPIVFAEQYVRVEDWWRVGAVVSVVNLTIWIVVGFWWWRVLGFWG